MYRLRKKMATLLMVLILASMTAIAVPVHANTIEHSEEWTPFEIRDQKWEDRAGVVSVVISGLSVSGDLYVGNTVTLSGTVDMKADPGIHGWWIHQAWACSWGYAALSHGGSQLHYEESPEKWADGYILSGWWWNTIPNDQSQTWDFSFDFTPTEAGTYTLKAFGHANAGYWRQHYDSGHPGWSWSSWVDEHADPLTFEVVLGATVDIAPETLNVKSNGQWITAHIGRPEGYAVSNIKIASIELTTEVGGTFPIVDASTITDSNLMVKFDRAALVEYLGDPDLADLGEGYGGKFYDVILTVTGKLTDGTPFAGTDAIKVIRK